MLRRLLQDRSLRSQLIVTVVLVHAVLMAVFVLDLVVRQRAFLHAEHIQRSTSLAGGLARHVTGDVLAGDLAALQEAVSGVRDYPELQYAIITDPSGRVLAHTDAAQIGHYLSDPVSRDMLEGPGRVRVMVDSPRMTDIAAPIIWNDRVVGWTRFGSGLQSIERGLDEVEHEGMLYALGAIVLGAALAYWTARGFTRNVSELLQVADATKTGRRDLRAVAGTRNEIGRLAGSFNAMLDALGERERALAQANEELEARVAERTSELAESAAVHGSILEQANDAFVSMDEHGLIVEWNRMAEATFGWSRDDAVGQKLADLIIPEAMRDAHNRGMQRFLQTGEARVIGQRIEVGAVTRDGREIPVELGMRLRMSRNRRHFDAFLRDITERKQLESSLAQQALHDMLTGLPNRRLLHESLPAAMQRADRTGKSLALFFLDLDRFKHVNDTLGHEAGDRVLCEFAQRIRSSVRAVDTVARLAGDEFVVVAEALSNPEADALYVAGKILRSAAAPYRLGAHSEQLSSSIGVALYAPASGISADELLLRADQAMYRSKHRGRGQATVWEPAARTDGPSIAAV